MHQKIIIFHSRKRIFLVLEVWNFKNYELIGFYLKKNDKRYEIFGITGAIFVSKGLKECLPQKKKMLKKMQEKPTAQLMRRVNL